MIRHLARTSSFSVVFPSSTQTKFSSFQRQLNLYGFIRISKRGKDYGAYYHECFLRGRPDLCAKVDRVKALDPSQKQYKIEPDFYKMPPVGSGGIIEAVAGMGSQLHASAEASTEAQSSHTISSSLSSTPTPPIPQTGVFQDSVGLEAVFREMFPPPASRESPNARHRAPRPPPDHTYLLPYPTQPIAPMHAPQRPPMNPITSTGHSSLQQSANRPFSLNEQLALQDAMSRLIQSQMAVQNLAQTPDSSLLFQNLQAPLSEQLLPATMPVSTSTPDQAARSVSASRDSSVVLPHRPRGNLQGPGSDATPDASLGKVILHSERPQQTKNSDSEQESKVASNSDEEPTRNRSRSVTSQLSDENSKSSSSSFQGLNSVSDMQVEEMGKMIDFLGDVDLDESD